MDSILLGDLRIDRIAEFSRIEVAFNDLVVGLPEDAISRNVDWLAPDHYNPHTDRALTTVQSWIVRTPRYTVLIDTCLGHDKTDPPLPRTQAGHGWIDRLAASGFPIESIDYVMCTHLHADHVGWNTRRVDGRWVPTFPNARYLFGRTEYEAWAGNTAGWAEHLGQSHVFNESVLPCIEHGVADLVDAGFAIDDRLVIEDASGHTAGNSVIRAITNAGEGLFVGDVVHSALQLRYPDCNSMACQFPEQARATRRRILADCADNGHLFMPAHFGAPHYGRVLRCGEAFRFAPGC